MGGWGRNYELNLLQFCHIRIFLFSLTVWLELSLIKQNGLDIPYIDFLSPLLFYNTAVSYLTAFQLEIICTKNLSMNQTTASGFQPLSDAFLAPQFSFSLVEQTFSCRWQLTQKIDRRKVWSAARAMAGHDGSPVNDLSWITLRVHLLQLQN